MDDQWSLLDYVVGDSLYFNGIEYRKIWDTPGYYVNEYGDVISTYKNRVRKLKTWPNQYGHRYVGLVGPDGKTYKESVHRLVAQAFVPKKRYSDNVVRHLDDNPENNDAYNLAWGTQADNVKDCRDHGRMFMKPIYCYETDTVYQNGREAAKAFGVTPGLISMCCHGKTKVLGGKYHLCYYNELEQKLDGKEEWLIENSAYRPVVAINCETGDEIVFNSRKQAAMKLGIPGSSISNVISGYCKQAHGWKFVDMEDYDE